MKLLYVFQIVRVIFSRAPCVCLLLLLALLSSCSNIKLGYTFADTYLKYKVSSLFDLDNTQKQFVYDKVNVLYAWHRQEELVSLIAFAKQVKQASADAIIDPDEFNQLFFIVDAGRIRYFKKIVPDMVELLAMLSNEQVDSYKETRQEDDAEYFEDIENTEEERIEKRLEKSVDTYESWFDQLTEQQIDFIRSTIDTSDARINIRKERRKRSREFFYTNLQEHRTDSSYMTALFNRYIDDPDFLHLEKNKAFVPFLEKTRISVPAFFTLLSADQINYFHGQIDELIDDLEDLQQQGN